MIRRLWRRCADRAARAYIAGPRLEDALRVAGRLSACGFASTLGYWDSGRDAAAEVAFQYHGALQSAGSLRDGCVAVKAPALGMDAARLWELAAAARRSGTLLHFDSLGPETAAPTFERIESLVGICNSIGCTLPGRWRRSRVDAERAVRLGLRIRVVKGQWPDEVRPEQDLSPGFLQIVRLLAGKARHVSVATHDVTLALRSLRILRDAGTSCELELLWGLPHVDSMQGAREMQVPVRFYVPYGYAWLPYAVSQARRNPRILWWIARDLLRHGTPLQAPADARVPG